MMRFVAVKRKAPRLTSVDLRRALRPAVVLQMPLVEGIRINFRQHSCCLYFHGCLQHVKATASPNKAAAENQAEKKHNSLIGRRELPLP